MKKLIKSLLREGLLDEVSQDVYDLVKTKYANSRIIMSHEEEINYRPTPIGKQSVAYKPKGLWYGIGTEWIDFARDADSLSADNEFLVGARKWETEHVFLLDINESRMKIIRTADELKEFDKQYGEYKSDFYERLINWVKVANDYDGIEIAPYISSMRMDREVTFYYPWDIASGCIWGNGVVRGLKRLN